MLNTFSGAYWLPVHFLQRNASLDPSPIFLKPFYSFSFELEEWFYVFWIGIPYHVCVQAFHLNGLFVIQHSYCIFRVSSKWPYVYGITCLKIITFRCSSLREHSGSLGFVCLGKPFRAEIPRVSDSEDHSDLRPSPSQGLLPCIPAGEPGWLAPLALSSTLASYFLLCPTLDRNSVWRVWGVSSAWSCCCCWDVKAQKR